MAWLRRLPDGLGLYSSPTQRAWAVGEVRQVDDTEAARMLADHPRRFTTAAQPSMTAAAPSLTRLSSGEASGAALDVDVDALGFRELQRELKARGASGAGKRAELRERLRALVG